ncbi:CheR family methyltransferase [Sphingobium nicotianae]|uniref:protein-glutamate O-methyltransferase n=1 Tax=Sphingobium nicotianae TaxID=2782607 RepID=A0A9X1IT21_9SPHN|nr:protein-glutamate O-methyltransferase CheR [Sphingobium nicotianae]MBT2188892.1 protein-glutamate O-methyltransferase CheR [Sphingobium nicotianae]
MMISPPNRAIQRLGDLLSRHTGQALSESRRWRIETSLRPLMRERDFPSLDALLAAIDRDTDGTLLLETIDAMLNHESSFFRDIAVFQAIERKVLPALHEHSREKLLRIWCAGCSTGQEAYSLAMMIKRMGALWDGWRVSIHATDVSPVAIGKAKSGRYAQIDMQRGLPINELLRWFTPVGEDWQIADEIREMVHFQTDNLLDPRRLSGTYDLILCRNVLFYFPEDKRRLACDHIAHHARQGSYLVLGAGEMLTGGNNPFSTCRELSCVYVAERPMSGIGRLAG